MTDVSNKAQLAITIGAVIIALAAAGVAAWLWTSPEATLAGGDTPVVAVNETSITKDDLFTAMYQRVGPDVVDELVMRQLIVQKMDEQGLTVPDEDVQAEVDRITSNFGSPEKLQEALEQYHMTLERLQEEIRIDLAAKKLIEQTVEVTDDESRDYFEKNKEQYQIKEEVTARHILVDTQEKAEELLAQLKDGADFAELAKKHSVDPGSRDQGGELGSFPRGRMVKEFEEAAFDLEVDEISDIVQTTYGFHIIQVTARQEAREVAYDEVAEQIIDELTQEKASAKRAEYLQELRDEARIKYASGYEPPKDEE